MTPMQTTYLRAADCFRQVLNELRAADLVRPVPSCPGWTVSDVVTHVQENHELALGPVRAAAADDVMAAYALAIADDAAVAASAPVETLDLTLHAWDVARACGADLRLGEDQLAFLEFFAREAGPRLYVGGQFTPADLETVDPTTLDRQGVALLPYGRQVRRTDA